MDFAVLFVSKIIVTHLKLIANGNEVELKSIKCFTDHVLNEFEIEVILVPVKY